MQAINEYSGLSPSQEEFKHEILATKHPLVFRNLVAQWPLVKLAKQSNEQAIQAIANQATDFPCYTVVAPPDARGRLFYSDDLTGLNFKSVSADLPSTLQHLLGMAELTDPHAVSVQAASVKDCLPGFQQSHPLTLVDSSVEPTLWISNRSRVAAHFDLNDNIACVTTGRRRFTLFPPEQAPNLYPGPTLNSPGGVPTSMVDLRSPDLVQFPRFEIALENAMFAELAPGDAIFIPSPWWHSVESLDSLNVLVNYWWNTFLEEPGPSANNSMMLSMMTIAKMDEPQRLAWKALFDYFVFKTSGDPSEHLPAEINDLATELTNEQKSECFAFLRDKII
ncbi:cupin-like domain-containing protein [Arenicella sp. 4NH20-0111]|uniref:cupin-like domain-containing protein n=1 Tax=Arenicella sp. 4NH20-0111 TaxID=3127648 RepID=UPI00310B19DC